MRDLIILNTTSGWNLGDDLIRDGVLRLLDIGSTEPVLWLNRTQTVQRNLMGERRKDLWTVQRNAPSLNSVLPHTRLFVAAGTPEWIDSTEEVYAKCLRFGVPVLLVGVAMFQEKKGIRVLRRLRDEGLLLGATVRDAHAQGYLTGLIPAPRIFPDPAFHAGYPQREKDIDTVLNYRARGGNGRYDDAWDSLYLRLYDHLRDRVGLVTVHEAPEYPMAKKLFPRTPVFFDSDYRKFKEIYARARFYVGGRIHGATPVAATGGRAYLLYEAGKKDAIVQVSNRMSARGLSPNISLLDVAPNLDALRLEGGDEPSRIREFFESERLEHRRCLAGFLRKADVTDSVD